MSPVSHPDYQIASEGEDIAPLIRHECEVLRNASGKYEQIYNYYTYEFSNLPDADKIVARAYFGERLASIIKGYSPDSPKSAALVVSYFERRLFDGVDQLSGSSKSGGYEPLWRRQDDGE